VFKRGVVTDQEIIEYIVNGDFLSNLKDKDVKRIYANALLNETYITIRDFNERETEILRERLGINESRTPKSLEAVGKMFGISKDRIRIIEDRVIRKLKHPSRYRYLQTLDLSDSAKEFYFANNLNMEENQGNYRLRIPENVNIEENIDIIREIENVVLKISNNVAHSKIKELEEKLIQKEKFEPRIEELDLSVVTYNRLKKAGINTIGDILTQEKDFLIRCVGHEGLFEIRKNMHSLGLEMNETVEKYIGIEELNLTVRSYDRLKRSGINTVDDLQKIDIDRLFRIRNLGRKSTDEIVEKMHSLGLGMHETVEEYFQGINSITKKMINVTKPQLNIDEEVEVIDFEEQTEHTIKENDETKKRIDEKEKLLLRYKEVSQEKESLLKKEAALDAELQEIMQKIQNSNMEKKDERKK